MSVVKVNRELLTDVVDDLDSRHLLCLVCSVPGRECPTAQRVRRLRGVLDRSQQQPVPVVDSPPEGA